jgi:hypothetical protein
MSETEFLFAIAQVAATFAGFSTLVVAIRQDPSKSRGGLVTARLISMLQQSLITILFCFVPFLPQHAGLSAIYSWRLSSGLFLVAWFIHYFHNLSSLRSQGIFAHLSRSNRWNVFVVHPIAMAALALGSFGLWGNKVGMVYLCCTLVMLYLCGFLFLQQVRALNVDGDGTPNA